MHKSNPRKITYDYDDEAYQAQFRLLLDGILDEVEKKRKQVTLQTMETLSPTHVGFNSHFAFGLSSPVVYCCNYIFEYYFPVKVI